ncbi:hypothetical protein H6G06_02645 [Anabaena sphaerica FACHB-251]|uniref:Uncharacterized protein n=1 Tax=Anabaena sphaerica FACHB-251 TaxID=2692883 RepID=A0A926WFA1_9NOST|nr:hypothetical protein [Anabaena sphaerica]MBD2292406.1 hypothetical protein [Anabaena sphaerica FACHB-251]
MSRCHLRRGMNTRPFSAQSHTAKSRKILTQQHIGRVNETISISTPQRTRPQKNQHQ